jgi:hypothetical protein
MITCNSTITKCLVYKFQCHVGLVGNFGSMPTCCLRGSCVTLDWWENMNILPCHLHGSLFMKFQHLDDKTIKQLGCNI